MILLRGTLSLIVPSGTCGECTKFIQLSTLTFNLILNYILMNDSTLKVNSKVVFTNKLSRIFTVLKVESIVNDFGMHFNFCNIKSNNKIYYGISQDILKEFKPTTNVRP